MRQENLSDTANAAPSAPQTGAAKALNAAQDAAPQAGAAKAASGQAASTAAAQNAGRSYIAFISYRHLPLDKQAAELIQKKIENYTIPKELREQFGGKKFGHVFRDEDELPTAASLTDSIYYALDHSKFLVVICTPGLPQSKWCEAEIKYFLKTHDRDHILAVLVDGEPAESFSPYMLHDFDEDGNPISDIEPLAANIAGPGHTINRKALNKEIVRLYATFIGCPFDSLWQRERRARTNRLLSIAGVAIAILCVFLGVLLNRNARIREQNIQIEAQNNELQTRLSSALVDGGLSKLEAHNIKGALQDALASMESGDPSLYDHRAGKLLSDTLCAYQKNTVRSSIIYEQSTDIQRFRLSADKERLFVLDDVGVLRCLQLPSCEVLWEHPTGSMDTQLYTQTPADRMILRSPEGTFCLSAADGSTLWSFPNRSLHGNSFQAISDDGSLFAVIDEDSDNGIFDLVFINTKDGSERGRIDLTDSADFKPSFSYIEQHYSYAAAFSSDNSRFVLGMTGITGDGIDINATRFWSVDLGTLTKKKIGTSETKYRMFYGADIDPDDGSVFIAAYTSTVLYTVLCTEDGDSYKFTENTLTHSFRSESGFMVLDDAYGTNEDKFLSERGRVYLMSDNQMFIFDRASNRLLQNYSMSGAIISAYWTDPENAVLETITDDANIIDYYMDYGENLVMNGMQGKSTDQSVMTRACAAGNDSVAEGGSYYNTSSDAPGRLFLVEFVSDPNAQAIHPAPADMDAKQSYTYLLSETSDVGFMFYNMGCAASFDRHSGKILKSVDFGTTVSSTDALIVDDEHFLSGSKLYGLDGTITEYGEPVQSSSMSYSLYYPVRLSTGQILSRNSISCPGYTRVLENGETMTSILENPQYCAVWLDGKPVMNFCDPDKAVLFFNDSREEVPFTAAGANGLVLVYGRVIDIAGAGAAGAVGSSGADGKTYSVRADKELCFMDALTQQMTFIKDAYPNAGTFKPAFAHKKHLCAAAYEDGTICLYDVDAAAATPLSRKYNAGEIANLCFSDDDAYLLILTSSGRLDIYATGGADAGDGGAASDGSAGSGAGTDAASNGSAGAPVEIFSDKISIFQQNVSSLSRNELRARPVGETGNLLITLGIYCLVLETGSGTPLSEFTGTLPAYDPAEGKVYFMVGNYKNSSYIGSDIVSYPVYDIDMLRDWAQRELQK